MTRATQREIKIRTNTAPANQGEGSPKTSNPLTSRHSASTEVGKCIPVFAAPQTMMLCCSGPGKQRGRLSYHLCCFFSGVDDPDSDTTSRENI